MLTIDEAKAALPANLRPGVTQDLVDLVNTISADPEVASSVRNNFVSYTGILSEGKFKLEDYIHAITYVSYKVMGLNNKDAYANTFPLRYQGLVAKGATDKHISAYVAAYNKNKLVNMIYERTMIPIWVLNQDAVQKAINTQLDLMVNAKSEKVRSDAANSILTHVKPPEKREVNLNIGLEETSGMVELRDMLGKLAQQQKDLIEQGVPTRDIAHQKLIEATAKDVTPVKDS